MFWRSIQLRMAIQLRISLCIRFAPGIIVFTIRNKTTGLLSQWSLILIVKRDSGIFTQIRASFVSLWHPGLSKRGRIGHPRGEIRASLDEISPPRLAMCRRLQQKFCDPNKATHQITKPCKYYPLRTFNNLWKALTERGLRHVGMP